MGSETNPNQFPVHGVGFSRIFGVDFGGGGSQRTRTVPSTVAVVMEGRAETATPGRPGPRPARRGVFTRSHARRKPRCEVPTVPSPARPREQPRASGEDRRAELLSPGVLAAGQTQVPTMEPGAQPMARGDGGRTTPLLAHVTQKPCKARAESWGAGWREGCRGLGSTFPEDAAPGAGRLRARSSQKAGVGTPLPRSGPGGRWVTAAALGSRADSGTAEDGSRRGSPPRPTPLPVATPLPLSGEVRAFLSLRK